MAKRGEPAGRRGETAGKRERRLAAEHVLWHALAKHAGKIGERDRLLPGKSHSVRARITATVDEHPVSLGIAGQLTVNFDQVVATSAAPPTAELLALVLIQLPKAARERWLEELPQQFAAAGKLPEVDEQLATQCAALLTKLRYVGSTTRRGSVTFQPDPDAGGAAAAKAA